MAAARQYTPATNLDDVYKTLSLQPLTTKEELNAFYREEMNEVRGGDKVAGMMRGLNRAYGGAFYKTFFMGHPGVGKSTEMTRLSYKIADKYQVIRFSAETDLDAAGFKPFDVLLVMMIRLAEEMHTHHLAPADDLIRDIQNWFGTEKVTDTTTRSTSVAAAAGMKPSPVSVALSGLLGFFAELKGEIKYTADRKTETTEYRLNAISILIGLLNRLLTEANSQLKKKEQKEWLFIGEDFDKPGIPNSLLEALFVNYANIFSDLQTHLIFNIPIALAYSEKAQSLTLGRPCIIHDTPVYRQDHSPHAEGRAAVESVLKARMMPELFDVGQCLRLVVASGGNLRDLFEMTAAAADNAALRGAVAIGDRDVTRAITDNRVDYVNRLGVSPYDPQPITYDQKAEKLVQIYYNAPGSDVADPILHSLLRARAVQEFNDTRWFGVHPLVVDTLIRHEKLKPKHGKPVEGGSL